MCKNYRVEGGLSERLHSVPNDLCQIKAMLGKGLGLKETSQGLHIAFTAGTGIMPFIDLVALMLRGNLGLLSQRDLPAPLKLDGSSTFKLVLYVAFDNRKDAYALKLLEGLYEVTQKRGLKNFELVLRFKCCDKPNSR